MTTIASSQGAAEVINARRTESSDAPEILRLINSNTQNQFGKVNIVHLIEKANLAVTLINEENEVLGFAAFLDHPPLDVCDSARYEYWMKNKKYNLAEQSTPLNSLFLHYFVATPDYTIGCATEIIRTVFNAVPNLHFVFLAMKKSVQLEQALKEVFARVEHDKEGGSEYHDLFVCHRHDHVPVLHIRRAVVEDHDDLTPIFNRLNDQLVQTYGDYFLAEMIEAQDENNFALVAEVGGKAIGFMSLCGDVNYNLLQNNYELEAFHGLQKPHPDDKLEPTPPASRASSVKEEPAKEIAKTASVVSMTNAEALPAERSSSLSSVSRVSSVANQTKESDQALSNVPEERASVVSVSDPAAVMSQVMGSSASLAAEEDVVFEPLKPNESFISHLSLVQEEVMSSHSQTFKPEYAGDSNCFSIQLFAIDELYEMRSADFLPAVFKLFPDKEFVVITVPHMVPEFPLLQHFIRVTPIVRAPVKQELYVFHRSGILANFFVRMVETDDIPKIEDLVASVHGKHSIIDDVKKFNEARRDDDGTEIQAFVATCSDQIVGVAVTRREEDIEYVRSHYNIEDFIYFNHHRRDEHGHLHHFALNPVFQHYTKHFIKEVLRQGHKSCLYYPVFPIDQDENKDKPTHTLLTGLNFLVPVRSRSQIDYPLEDLGINAPSERVIKQNQPYALYHINRKLTLEPKVTINARIVVVGASTIGISLLETLVFCPHLRFNNLTLISQRGLPTELHNTDLTYTKDELAKMSLRTWVNVVAGTMVAIDRAHKRVVLADGSSVAYDHLVLCTGQQYQIPKPSGLDITQDATNHNLEPNEIDAVFDGNVPGNVLAVNDSVDMEMVTRFCESQVTKFNTVIYGNSLDAYVMVQSLLSLGVSGENISLVQPPESRPVTLSSDPFNEPPIFRMVSKALEETGVKVFKDHVLAEWDLNEEYDLITSLSFTTPNKPCKLPCDLLLSFHPRRIDYNAFTACNDSCLVFDGRLVINADFCTNDPAIRAAGPLTKYARRYHAQDWSNHDGFNSIEIGFRLAVTLLSLFDPTLEQEPEDQDDPNNKLVPIFENCKAFQGELPGGYSYFHARKPGLSQPYEAQLASTDHGREIITGSPESANYFRLHFNQFKSVETITCLAKGHKIPARNYVQLYGVHERYLNNLLSRVDEGLLSDLYKFFSEPWSMAIFHDRFKDLKQEVRDILSVTPSGGENLSSIYAHVCQLVEEDLVIDKNQRASLEDFYTTTGQRKIISNRLLSFLSYNYYHLPMYAKPGMV